MGTEPRVPATGRRLPWWIIAAVATLAVGVVAAVVVLARLSPAAVQPTASSSPALSRTPSPVPSLVAAASSTPDATPSASGDAPASITLMVIAGGVRRYPSFADAADAELYLDVLATLTGGPAAYLLDGIDTIERDAGDYELKIYNPTCNGIRPSDCVNSVRLLCSAMLSLEPGDSLLIRINMGPVYYRQSRPCAPHVTPRPKLRSDPESIRGTFHIDGAPRPGGAACGYVLDKWGHYWDVIWPAGYHVGRPSDGAPRIMLWDAEGRIVARPLDIISVRGARRDAELTGCAARVSWHDAEGIGYQAIEVTVVDPYEPHATWD